MDASATSGTCGESLTWRFDATSGALIISGTGQMENYDSRVHTPWYKRDYDKSITSIIIEEGVTTVGNYAFSDSWVINDRRVVNISIPDTVTSIGEYAFEANHSIESIVIPDSVTHIGKYAFEHCLSLTNISIPDSVMSIGIGAFARCTRLTSAKLPNGLACIENYLFSGCEMLSSIDIPSSVTSIGEDAFRHCCYALKSVTIPDGVISIGEDAFNECYTLESVIIPDSVVSIGSCAFKSTGLTNVVIPSGITSIELATFSGCESLRSVTIPDSVTRIGDSAFYNCNSLIDITIPNSIVSIGEGAFFDCDNLTSLTIPSRTESIGNGAVKDCDSLAEIIVDGGNPYYASVGGALYTKDITELVAYPKGKTKAIYDIPSSVKVIHDSAFYACSNLTSISIPYGVTDIGTDVFVASGLTGKVIIPGSVKSVGLDAFNGCNNITTLVFQEGVEQIGRITNSSGLTSLIIPKSIKSMHFSIREYDYPLDVYYAGNESDWNAILYNSLTSDNLAEYFPNIHIHWCSTGPDNSDTETKSISGVLRSTDAGDILWECSYQVGSDGMPRNGRIDITMNNSNQTGELYLYNGFGAAQFPWELEPYNIPKSAITKVVVMGPLAGPRFRIAANSFQGYDKLQTLVLDQVSGIDSYAFEGCTSLEKVSRWDSDEDLAHIGKGAFKNCISLAEMNFSGVTTIGDEAFQNTPLGEIQLHKGITEIGSNAFADCEDVLIYCYKDSYAHLYAVENSIPYAYIDSGFTLGRDNNSFIHSDSTSEAGFYGISSYALNDVLYNRLTQGQSAKDKSEMKKRIQEEWNGSCYGIAATMALVYDDILQLSDITTATATSYYNLPLPYSDTRLLNGINYYQLSQYVVSPTVSYQGTNSYKSLSSLIDLLKEDQIVVLCYGYTKNGERHGHAILACEVIQQSNGTYDVKLYDENCVPRNEYFIDMTVSADLTSFEFTDSNGNLINNSTCDYLEVTSTSDLYSVKPYAVAYSDVPVVTIVFPMNVRFSLQSKDGKSVAYSTADGFSGTMPIHSIQAISNDENSYWKITVPESDTFTVSDCSSELEIDIYSDDDFLSVGGEGISSAELNLGSSITINDGVDGEYSFRAYISTDTIVAENEANLISIVGSASNTVSVSYVAEENQVIAESENAITNATIHSLIQADVFELSDQNSDDGIISVNAIPSYRIIALAEPSVGGRAWIQGVDSNSSSDIYEKGMNVTVVAEANNGYRFVCWNENDRQVSTNETYTFKAEGDRTLTAVFELINGSDSPNPSDPSIPSTPSNPGEWHPSSYNPSAASYSIAVPSVTGGKISVSPKSASKGSTVTITATPDAGYQLTTLTVTDNNGKEVSLTDKGSGAYAFTMPGGKVSINAVFQPVETSWSNPFTDVSTGTWYYDAVKFVSETGLMNGVGNGLFAPEENLSRGMLTQILYNKGGRPTVDDNSTFADVASGAWYFNAVSWASEKGIAGGYGNGLFRPNDNITREQLAVMLWRYAGKPVPPNLLLNFTDANLVSDYAMDAMRWSVDKGIINGKGNGILDPRGYATRAETAQMLKNYLSK